MPPRPVGHRMRINLRVPLHSYVQIVAASLAAGMSVNAWCTMVLTREAEGAPR